jgi:hypothetical protein
MALELRPNCEYCDLDLPRHPPMPAFAPMSARSARTVSQTSFIMSAQTAAADLRQGQSDRPRNGDQAYRLPSNRPRANVSASPLSQPKSWRSRTRSRTSRPRTAESAFVRSPGARGLLVAQRFLCAYGQGGKENLVLSRKGSRSVKELRKGLPTYGG